MTSREKKILSAFNFKKGENWIWHFYDFDIDGFERLLRKKDEQFWQNQGERKALKIFHAAAELVPAYKDFLKRNKINHKRVKTISDFKAVPITDKNNYINSYPLEKRCWYGKIFENDLITVSSGTSGEPNFWPRDGFQEFESAVVHELLYKSIFEIKKYKSILIIGFPMGVYVSGIATVLPSFMISAKAYNLTVVSAGNNKSDLLKFIKRLQGQYDQVILAGHPFFIKDIIETGNEMKINWSKNRLRLMFCSGGFNEEWREYIIKQTGIRFPWDIISTYGSSEMLLMANETPYSIYIRRKMEKDESFRKNLIQNRPVPNLFQYNPFLRYVETWDNELIFTSLSGLPLIRFNLHDSGILIKLSEIKKQCGQIDNLPFWQLPFLGLWGRSDYTIKFYAVNIYPEHINSALNLSSFLRKITGKFTMRKDYLKNFDEFLEINIELRQGFKLSGKLTSLIQNRIIRHLKEINMEYLDACSHLEKNLKPRIKLWPYQHEKYFKIGLKPKYILSNSKL